MRPAIPAEEYEYVRQVMDEMLPSIDPDIRKELADDYMLDTLNCVVVEDFAIVTEKSCPWHSIVEYTSARATDAAHNIIARLQSDGRLDVPPHGVLAFVRAPHGPSDLSDYKSVINAFLKVWPESFIIVGWFMDPDATEIKLRVILFG